MEVEYELTPDDLYHFHLRASRSSQVKRAKLKVYLSVLLCVVILSVLPAVSADGFDIWQVSLWWILYFFPAVALLTWLFDKRQTRRAILDLVKQEKPGRGQLGAHKISLNEEGLVESTAVGESRTSWAGMDRIEQDQNYIYIYTAPHAAHIIPKRAFNNSQEAESFYQLARVSKLEA